MKKTIIKEELYPIFMFDPYGENDVEISEEILEEYDRVHKQLRELNGKLAALYTDEYA